jgi:hypothetical protein
MAIRLTNETHNFRFFSAGSKITFLEAFAHLSQQAKRTDITNQDLDILAEYGQALYDGRNKGMWNKIKIFFGSMIPSYRLEIVQNSASHENLKTLICNRKAALSQNSESDLRLPDVSQTFLKAKDFAQVKKSAQADTVDKKETAENEVSISKLIKKYEKMGKKLTTLKEQAKRETLPAKMKVLSNYPLLSRDISKAISGLKSLLRAKSKNQETNKLIKEQIALLGTLKKQVDLSSAQLAKRIESMSKVYREKEDKK